MKVESYVYQEDVYIYTECYSWESGWMFGGGTTRRRETRREVVLLLTASSGLLYMAMCMYIREEKDSADELEQIEEKTRQRGRRRREWVERKEQEG